ncbi:hypothetical protein A2U01_0055166, partial [Trifolium medium]|nr:hypothetical protein [Trifolium medium]
VQILRLRNHLRVRPSNEAGCRVNTFGEELDRFLLMYGLMLCSCNTGWGCA